MPASGVRLDWISLSVAELQLVLDARGIALPMAVPPGHVKFLAAVGPEAGPYPGVTLGAGSSTAHGKTASVLHSECSPSDTCGLTLTIRDGALRGTEAWRPLHTPPGTWQLWQDEAGRYVFAAAPNFCPPSRQITVDTGFRSGEVRGPFGEGAGPTEPSYPLLGLDIMLFVNWLAESGDLILHAAGVVADGRGYAFAGVSGAGKSTLAAAFAERSGITVLGEDSLVLRCMDGRFRIHGTPWHIDPARCSPMGAPLEKLFFLDRTGAAGVRSAAPLEGVSRLLQTAFVPYYRPEAVARIVDNLARLAERVPFDTLSYRLGSDPMAILRDA